MLSYVLNLTARTYDGTKLLRHKVFTRDGDDNLARLHVFHEQH